MYRYMYNRLSKKKYVGSYFRKKMATTMKIANRATRNSTRIDDSVFLNVYENGAGTSTTHGQESLLQQRKQFFDEIFRSLGVYE